MPQIKVNASEKEILEYYESRGYRVYRRGWPDFCFEKDGQVLFVEVKRKNQAGIKPDQQAIRDLFRRLGLTYMVAFGLNESGCPHFRTYSEKHGRALKKEKRKIYRMQKRLERTLAMQSNGSMADRVTDRPIYRM